MINKLAKIVKLKSLDELEQGDIAIEDCGKFDEELVGYGFVLGSGEKEALQEMYDTSDKENADHMSVILASPKGFLIAYTAITNECGISITEHVLDNVDNDIDRFFGEFGYDDENVVEEPRYVEEEDYRQQQIHQEEHIYHKEPEYVEDVIVPNYERGQTTRAENQNKNARKFYAEEPVRVSNTQHSYEEYIEKEEPVTNENTSEVYNREEFIQLTEMILEADSGRSSSVTGLIRTYDSGNEAVASELLVAILDELEHANLL